MTDIDPLAFQISFALTHKTGGETKKLIRSLPDIELGRLAQVVADHLTAKLSRRLSK